MKYNRRSKVDFSVNRSRVFASPMVTISMSEAKPWKSLSAGVMKNQVQDFNDYYKQNGIAGAYHEPDGTLVCESRKARKDVGKLRGIHDNDAGYGDWGGS